MKKLTQALFLIILLLASAQMIAQEQNIRISLPDTINLSDRYIKGIYYKLTEDTVGFIPLTDKTSLNQYKGKENKDIMRVMRKIRGEMENDIIIRNVAWKSLTSLRKYPEREEEVLVLRYPKYKLIKNGVILIGVSDSFAPWNDMITNIERLECYFVGFDKSVSLIKKIYVNTKRIMPTGSIVFDKYFIEFLKDTIEVGDSLTIRTNPYFEGGQDALKAFIIENTVYPELALEVGLMGRVVARFTVDSDGKIQEAYIVRGVDPLLDEVLLRTVRLMDDKWKPGTADGKAIPTQVILNIIFKPDD